MDTRQSNKERGEWERNRKKRGNFSMADLAPFHKWLNLKGFKTSKLKPAYFPGTGRGLMATRPIGPGDVVVSIPRKVMVTCDDVLKDPRLRGYFEGSSVRLRALEVLTSFLAYHRHLGEESNWRPYLESLPKAYTVPLYCSEEEIDVFPEFLRSPIARQRQDVLRCQANLRKVFGDAFLPLETDDVKWSWFSVSTRAVYLKNVSPSPLVADEDVCALAPYLDLLNHSHGAQVTAGVNPSNGCYEVVSRGSSYGPSDQVFIHYGPHDNLKLYLEYGFVLAHNPHDFVPLTPEEVEASARSLVDDARGSSMGLKGSLVRSHFGENLGATPQGPSWNLEAASTVYLMTAEETSRWQQVVYEDLRRAPCRSLVVECVALVMRRKADLIRSCLARADDLPGRSEAFEVGRDALEGCCRILQDAQSRIE